MSLCPIPRRVLAHLIVLAVVTAGTRASEITPAGEMLARVLDSMDVERHWLADQTIHWRTGTPDRRGHQSATHCSAFVAAACDRMGVYILRPPDHSQTLLASAERLAPSRGCPLRLAAGGVARRGPAPGQPWRTHGCELPQP